MPNQPDRFDREIVGDAEVLYDHRTETTRFCLWRHLDLKTLSLAMVQGDNVVSVNVDNLIYLMAKILPEHVGQKQQ